MLTQPSSVPQPFRAGALAFEPTADQAIVAQAVQPWRVAARDYRP
jgi:hypothetical protein